MSYQLGLDCSHWQETINFETAEQAGIQFAYIRASNGMAEDSRFFKHWAASLGLLERGVYHYYRDAQGSAQQAYKYFETVNKTGDLGELAPALDLEEIDNVTLTPGKVKLCLDELEKLFKVKPLIYSNAYILDKYFSKASWLKEYPLWVSNPPFFDWFPTLIQYVAQYLKPRMPKSHTVWDIWQFTFKAPAAKYGASGTFLDLNFRASPVPPPAPGEFMVKFKVLTSVLNIRNFPDYEQSAVVGQLKKDDVVTATSVTPESPFRVWVKIGADQYVALVHDGTTYLQNVV